MNLWSVLEERIVQQGVRIEERLNLLNELKVDHETGGVSVTERKEALVLRIDDAAACLTETLRG